MEKKLPSPDLELRVQVLNINPGYNEILLEGCRPLKDYMLFVEKARSYIKTMPLETAVDRAITECIAEDTMADFLMKNRSEVKKVCIYEYDAERHIQMEREEAREEGVQEGLQEGLKKGLREGIRTLIKTYKEYQLPSEKLLSSLTEEFSLTDEQARKAVQEYERGTSNL